MSSKTGASTGSRGMAARSHDLSQEHPIMPNACLDVTQPVVRMTLRVSRDSGRTWGPLGEVRVGENPAVPDSLGGFPPCACHRCGARDSTSSHRGVSR